MFSVGAQGRGQRTPRARACWRLRVGQGGNVGTQGRETGGKRVLWGFIFRRLEEQPTEGSEGVWVLTRRLLCFGVGLWAGTIPPLAFSMITNP